MSRTVEPSMRLPRTNHLKWLYLLVLIPIVTDTIEKGAIPTPGRELTSEVVLMFLTLTFVYVIIKRSRALVSAMHAQLHSTQQLHHANRLATVGQLAAGIAHELGSPLQVVAGRGKMIETGEASGDDAKESGKIIVTQTKRMTLIIRGLLDFARRQPVRRTATELETVARDVQRMLGPLAKKKAVVLDVEVGAPNTVDVDPVQVQQALTNLVMNAIQAVGEGGSVVIRVERDDGAPPSEVSGLRRIAPNGDGYSCVRVTDDGPGIDPAHKGRVFEPFFTTKDVGEGTGLGLAVAYGLVRENGGWITVESEVGHGATFAMFFPSIERP